MHTVKSHAGTQTSKCDCYSVKLDIRTSAHLITINLLWSLITSHFMHTYILYVCTICIYNVQLMYWVIEIPILQFYNCTITWFSSPNRLKWQVNGWHARLHTHTHTHTPHTHTHHTPHYTHTYTHTTKQTLTPSQEQLVLVSDCPLK